MDVYGRLEQMLSDNGTTFYAIEADFYATEADKREKGLTEFKFLIMEKITFIVGRVDHPQTNGKVEKFLDIFERKVRFFNTVDGFMHWYNYVRPHGAFDFAKLETPAVIHYQRFPKMVVITGHHSLGMGGWNNLQTKHTVDVAGCGTLFWHVHLSKLNRLCHRPVQNRALSILSSLLCAMLHPSIFLSAANPASELLLRWYCPR